MIVGLTGYARSGKDTLAKSLRLRAGFRRIAFADKLKEFALGIDPIVAYHSLDDKPVSLTALVKMVGWDKAKELGEVRELLQNVGDHARLIFGDDVWIKATFPVLHTLLDAGHHVVYTDVRYPNEADFIRQRQGVIIKVTRPGVQAVNGHVTEKNVDLITEDVLLCNDSTQAVLGRNAIDHLSRYL